MANKMGHGFKDEVGNVYGKLTVIEYFPNDKRGAYWKCRCECGNVCVVFGGNLRAQHYAHRSCIHCRNVRHGLSNSPEHKTWRKVRQRCLSKSNKDFHHYGERGIAFCDRWNVFENFLSDMGKKPFPKATIERIDNDGNYEPSNCRWATQGEQTRNTRRSRMITHNGKTQLFMDWVRELGIHPSTLHNRLRRGWSIEMALSTPVKMAD